MGGWIQWFAVVAGWLGQRLLPLHVAGPRKTLPVVRRSLPVADGRRPSSGTAKSGSIIRGHTGMQGILDADAAFVSEPVRNAPKPAPPLPPVSLLLLSVSQGVPCKNPSGLVYPCLLTSSPGPDLTAQSPHDSL